MQKLSRDQLQSIFLRMLRTLRGSSSQETLARRLGKSHDAVSRWESGSTAMKWQCFCEFLDATVPEGTKPLARVLLRVEGSLFDWPTLFRCLIGTQTTQQLSARLDLSPATIRKWLEPDADPMALEVLRTIEELTPFLVPFLAKIIDLSADPEIGPRYQVELSRGHINSVSPVAAAVMALLEQGAFRTSPQTNRHLGKSLGVETEVIDRILPALVETGAVVIKDETYILDPLMVDTRLGKAEDGFRSKRYWLQRGLNGCVPEHFDKNAAQTHFGHLIFSCGPDTYAEVGKLFRAFYNQVADMLRESDGPGQTSVGVLNIQLYDERFLERFPESPGLPKP